ncbi:FmdB family zinc ribbon protein [Noviherbaspirillum pedocola]|uniref:Zinc ribbon domain-containing protein n=1 Tax=Noviherbaspirillum pedocola TaxID=2801341 RepID=A0A934SXA0_9BURK|nr:FmdB family zinc ribbon protein [Noviherbaspirillum pedocola]MBK4737045.1 zinc ribbon domain-containing protein [Noviherbaspirillum pedocola]
MPFYDIHCSHCEGNFEKMLKVDSLHQKIECPYCGEMTAATPSITGRVELKRVDAWRPQSLAQQLAGEGITGPGTKAGAARSSVLHNCKGYHCSICA